MVWFDLIWRTQTDHNPRLNDDEGQRWESKAHLAMRVYQLQTQPGSEFLQYVNEILQYVNEILQNVNEIRQYANEILLVPINRGGIHMYIEESGGQLLRRLCEGRRKKKKKNDLDAGRNVFRNNADKATTEGLPACTPGRIIFSCYLSYT